jgi:hypothetical protein
MGGLGSGSFKGRRKTAVVSFPPAALTIGCLSNSALTINRLICHNTTRIILDFHGIVINLCHIETYGAGRLQGCVRFWA